MSKPKRSKKPEKGLVSLEKRIRQGKAIRFRLELGFEFTAEGGPINFWPEGKAPSVYSEELEELVHQRLPEVLLRAIRKSTGRASLEEYSSSFGGAQSFFSCDEEGSPFLDCQPTKARRDEVAPSGSQVNFRNRR